MKNNNNSSDMEPTGDLLPAEDIFRNFVNSLNDAIFFINKRQGTAYASPACFSIFGYSPIEFLEIPNLLDTILTPAFQSQYQELKQDFLINNRHTSVTLELTWRKKEGALVYTETTFINLLNEHGESVGLQMIARDITKATLAERRNKVFIHVGEQLSSVVTVDEAAKAIAASADELFTWDACTFDLYSSEQHKIFSILNIDSIEGKRTEVVPTLTDAPPTARMEKVIKEGGTLFNRKGNETPQAGEYRFGDINRPSESIMSVPIRHNRNIIGLFSIQSYTQRLYTAESLDILQALADHCGGALERIRTREALLASEAKFRGLFEAVPDGVYQSTREGKFLSVNKALADILGYGSIDELMKIDIGKDLYHSQEEREKFVSLLERDNSLKNTELHWKKKNGQPVVLLENAHVVRNVLGQTLYYEGTLTDITGLKNIERALKESERKYRILIESMNEGVLQVDNDDTILFVNDRYCDLVGFSREELIGKRAYELMHDEEGKAIVKEKNKLRARGISDQYEIALRKKNGEVITVLISGSPIFNEQGNPVGSIGIHLDITARRKAEEELANQKAFLRQVIDLNPNFIFAKDRDGRFTLINRAMADTYGTSVEELIGKTDADFHPDMTDVARFHRDDLEVMSTLKEKFIPEEFITSRVGGSRWVQTIKRPILSRDGTAHQVLGVATDITERKKAEDAFRESEARFRKIFEEGPIGMAIIGLDMTTLEVNDALCKMTGYTRSELIAMPIEHITHPDDYEKDYQFALKLLKGEIQSYNMEKRYIRKDKSVIWGRITGSLVRDAGGGALYGIGIVEDITERKRVEEMLILLESAVQQANESITITTANLDLPGPEIVFVNPAFTKMTQYTQSEAIGKTPRILQGPKTDKALLTRLRETLERGEVFHGEAINYRKDKTEFFLEWHIAPIKNKEGITTHYIAVQRDITARKAYDEALRKSEKRYRLFFEEDLTGDYIALPDGTLIECNPSFQQMFGFKNREEALGFNIANLFPDPAAYPGFVERVTNEKKLVYDELELQRADGVRVSIIQNVIGIFSKEGEFRRFKGYMFDNTERKKLEQQLLHSQKMESIGTLAAGLAHNFNNIMSIILGYASAIKIGSASPKRIAENVDAISLAVKRGTGLVRQLTTFARSSEPVLMSVNLNTLLQEMEKIVTETFPESIHCSLQLNHDSASIIADPNQIHQALLNLCLNARDAMPQGGTLTLTTSILEAEALKPRYAEAGHDRFVCISVSDTGMGLKKEDREHIFEPFFTTKEIGKGTGLGLSVVYGIIKNHKGFIEVESENGKGAVFHLYFRLQAGIEKFTEEEADVIHTAQGGNETVLIVEDEEMLLELVKDLLSVKGYHILTATNGLDALEIFKSNYQKIAAILTDMGLPGLGGAELMEEIKKINKDVKFILASGYLDSDLRQRMIKNGAADFIQKPYDPDFLMKKIRDVIDGKN